MTDRKRGIEIRRNGVVWERRLLTGREEHTRLMRCRGWGQSGDVCINKQAGWAGRGRLTMILSGAGSRRRRGRGSSGERDGGRSALGERPSLSVRPRESVQGGPGLSPGVGAGWGGGGGLRKTMRSGRGGEGVATKSGIGAEEGGREAHLGGGDGERPRKVHFGNTRNKSCEWVKGEYYWERGVWGGGLRG